MHGGEDDHDMNDLARRLATAVDRAELGLAIEEHLRSTLDPNPLLVYIRQANGMLAAFGDGAPGEFATLPEGGGPFVNLAGHGACWVASRAPADDPSRAAFATLGAECLVPIHDRQGRLVGLLVLGPRSSAEPYSDLDASRLVSVAGHAGTAIEVIGLAERLAERMDAERRADREIAIAMEVQRRLFPQTVPELPHLDLAARCIHARAVGGDYYDFLDLGPGRIGLVLGDVSGKGVHAALRMANLQAHLRSQAASTPQDPLRVLRQANRMLWDSTQARDFATLFFGIFADSSRRLTYINCGHNPPVCLRSDGTVEWLHATATVLGAFEAWECSLGRMQLAPGDLLVAYSDGVTEAARGTAQFGEDRLVDVLRSHAGASPETVVSSIFDRVQQFSAGDQSDDLTLLVARVR